MSFFMIDKLTQSPDLVCEQVRLEKEEKLNKGIGLV